MKTEQHAAILGAYISRLSLADLRNILAAQQDVMAAAMNGNTGAQQDARRVAGTVIHAATASLIEHDRDTIRSIVKRVTA